MKPTHIEMEVKLIVPDAAALAKLPEALLETCRQVKDMGVMRIMDTYYDTAEWHLRRASFACRIRRAGKHVVLALKSLQRPRRGVSLREEYEATLPLPLPRDVGKRFRGRLGCTIREITGGAPLRTIFRIRNRRHNYRVQVGDLVAQVSADDFIVSSGSNRRRLSEVEIELIRGTEADIRRFATILRRRLRLSRGTRAKYQQGLAVSIHSPDHRA